MIHYSIQTTTSLCAYFISFTFYLYFTPQGKEGVGDLFSYPLT
jgi:hypothetical protein